MSDPASSELDPLSSSPYSAGSYPFLIERTPSPQPRVRTALPAVERRGASSRSQTGIPGSRNLLDGPMATRSRAIWPHASDDYDGLPINSSPRTGTRTRAAPRRSTRPARTRGREPGRGRPGLTSAPLLDALLDLLLAQFLTRGLLRLGGRSSRLGDLVHVVQARRYEPLRPAATATENTTKPTAMIAVFLTLGRTFPNGGRSVSSYRLIAHEKMPSTSFRFVSSPSSGDRFDMLLTNPPFGKVKRDCYERAGRARGREPGSRARRLLGLHLRQATQLPAAREDSAEYQRACRDRHTR